jgi:RNA polymerase sigma factor (sigma-70 family)
LLAALTDHTLTDGSQCAMALAPPTTSAANNCVSGGQVLGERCQSRGVGCVQHNHTCTGGSVNGDGGAPDGEMIRRSIDEPEVFEVIFERHFDAIYGYLARRGGKHVGEVVASETFCAAFDRRDRFDVRRGDARPWLYGIATNLLHRHWRTEGRRRRTDERFQRDRSVEQESAQPHDRLQAGLLDHELRAAVEELNDGDRDVLLLYAWGGLSYLEIADALDIPMGTVQSRLHRARTRVRHRLRPDDNTRVRTSSMLKGNTDG